jgi:hypothetical protein
MRATTDQSLSYRDLGVVSSKTVQLVKPADGFAVKNRPIVEHSGCQPRRLSWKLDLHERFDRAGFVGA